MRWYVAIKECCTYFVSFQFFFKVLKLETKESSKSDTVTEILISTVAIWDGLELGIVRSHPPRRTPTGPTTEGC